MSIRLWTMAANAWRAVQAADTDLVEAGWRLHATLLRVRELAATDYPAADLDRAWDWVEALEAYIRAKEARLRAGRRRT